MVPADVKANKNSNKKQKICWLYFTNFYKNYFQNLKYNVQKECIFHLLVVGILSILILYVKNRDRGGGGGEAGVGGFI